MWDGLGRQTRTRRGAARAHRKEIESDISSESVLRQKEACREAVEKCRAGRGAHIQWRVGTMVQFRITSNSNDNSLGMSTN